MEKETIATEKIGETRFMYPKGLEKKYPYEIMKLLKEITASVKLLQPDESFSIQIPEDPETIINATEVPFTIVSALDKLNNIEELQEYIQFLQNIIPGLKLTIKKGEKLISVTDPNFSFKKDPDFFIFSVFNDKINFKFPKEKIEPEQAWRLLENFLDAVATLQENHPQTFNEIINKALEEAKIKEYASK